MTPKLSQKLIAFNQLIKTLIEQWDIFSPTDGTTYQGFTIQFKLVPGANSCFLSENYQNILASFALGVETTSCWGAKKQGVSFWRFQSMIRNFFSQNYQ